MSIELKPRQDFLDTALACGASLTGKSDGSEAITVVFTIDAWRKFDSAIQQAKESEPVWFHKHWCDGDDIFYRPDDKIPLRINPALRPPSTERRRGAGCNFHSARTLPRH